MGTDEFNGGNPTNLMGQPCQKEMKVFFCVFLFLSVDKGQATTILADLYVESFGNIEEANMVRIMLFL